MALMPPPCNREGTPNRYHLIWLCPLFDRNRHQLLTLGPAPATEQEHVSRVRDDPTALEAITEYALENRLYKLV